MFCGEGGGRGGGNGQLVGGNVRVIGREGEEWVQNTNPWRKGYLLHKIFKFQTIQRRLQNWFTFSTYNSPNYSIIASILQYSTNIGENEIILDKMNNSLEDKNQNIDQKNICRKRDQSIGNQFKKTEHIMRVWISI